ncbi:MAG: PQQ-binding-like beta-propeller repeat protein [Fimbriimonadaceae bacterium]|nr:PQQ-binding-like beta-propeller repeat protein [Fimbriimonadaceae bacterium]
MLERFASSRSRWIAGLCALVAVAVGFAQDYPSLRGNNQGQGRNANPALYGPGIANLRWFHPNANDPRGGRMILDNASTTAAPWTAPAGVSRTGVWLDPTAAEDSPFGYRPTMFPSYSYATTVATSDQTDPTVGSTATFDWLFDPSVLLPAVNNIPQNYEIWVWLPIGPTTVGGALRYSQRYYVYEIQYESGKRWVEVLDSYLTGPGWARLGNGGATTNQLFAYDGTNPIRVRLHNTVSRNPNGGLSDTPGETLVYADAVMLVPQVGSYAASPVVGAIDAPGGGTETRVVAALNEQSLGLREGSSVTTTRGTVTSYSYNHAGLPNTWAPWSFTPLLESENTIQMDNGGAGVTFAPPWQAETIASGFFGTGYLAAPTTNTLGSATNVRYKPTLEDGEFEVWMWLPGDSNGEQFGQAVLVQVYEGATLASSNTVDMSLNRGWVRVGSQRFRHSDDDPIEVVVTNYSADPGDVGKKAFADAVRFVGASNLAINSTPVQTKALVRTTNGGPTVEKDVVIVAAENGRIYCLDAYGNGDGSTNVYWTYPSTPDPDNTGWTDPNQVAGLDGPGGVATMPTGFDLSSAIVQRINGSDFLFIASTNGRVYCLDMAGRGDMNFATRRPGTTTRVWSYPNDYPAAAQTSNLGAFSGSLVFETTAQGPTIFAATTQGRLYALNAVGGPNRTTNVRWAFPKVAQPTIGAIRHTPLIEFGNVYFGTDRFVPDGSADGVPKGRFYCLDMDDGTLKWKFESLSGNAPGDWGTSGPTSAPSAMLSDAGMSDTVFAQNQDGTLYAFSANGDGSGNAQVYWSTNELATGATGSLTFTTMSVYDGTGLGTHLTSPVVLVPTADGRFTAMFARLSDVNRFGTRRAWEYVSASDSLVASMAQGNGWLYGGDPAGNLYAWNNEAGAPITPGDVPGQQTIVENDPVGDDFRESKIKFITRDAYNQLRQTPAGLSYAQALLPANESPSGVFEWGQTIYILVYDFPYRTQDEDGNPVAPPAVNFQFSSDGRSNRNLTVESRQFAVPGPLPDKDGYAILSFTIQGGGVNALPPGDGRVSFSISTASVNTEGQRQNIVMRQSDSVIAFQVANPLALVIRRLGNGNPDPLRSIGATTDAADPQNLVNGSPDIPATTAREDLLTATTGIAYHGQAANTQIEVIDRSLMSLLRGPGRGLDNVRVERGDLAWTGGATTVIKPLAAGIFTGFEELPNLYPNTSLDYPDVRAAQVKVTKELLGQTENPVFGPVSLNPPTNVDLNTPSNRTLRPTAFDLEVDVPKYQPANLSTGVDSAAATIPYGYRGSVLVYVDTNGNGSLERGGRAREAFREMWLTTNVAPDERFYVGTPTVDLGSLAQGAGYAPTQPLDLDSGFTPWDGPFRTMFQTFTVLSESNVNLLNLRLAKATTPNGSAFEPWQLFGVDLDPNVWVNGMLNLHSDMDDGFSVTKRVMLQKPRVGDGGPTNLTVNPIRRANPNLGVAQGPLNTNPNFAPAPPRVTVSVPLGMPVGAYQQLLRVIEDTDDDSALALSPTQGPLESYSDPGFQVRFRVREGRLTSGASTFSAPMIDGAGSGSTFRFANDQPAGARDGFGNLVLMFASTRPSFAAAPPTEPSRNDAWRLYLSTIQGMNPTNGPSPLRDLNAFVSGTKTQWWKNSLGPFPSQPADTLFDSLPGETVIANTVRFGAPSLPTNAFKDAFSLAARTDSFIGYLGTAQKLTASGRVVDNRLYVQRIRLNDLGVPTFYKAGGGDASMPWTLPFDPNLAKGKPSLFQVGDTVIVMFAAVGPSESSLYVTTLLDGASGSPWGPVVKLDLGTGFEYVGSPSIIGRTTSGGVNVVEFAFEGKQRGRTYSAIYFGRAAITALGGSSSLSDLPTRTTERLGSVGNATFAARGILWNAAQTIELGIRVGTGAYQNLETAGTRQTDASGVISFDTKLGGKAYLDPSRGTVRFAGTVPPNNATLFLSYTPRALRASADVAANYFGPTLLLDRRYVADTSYWARPSGAPAQTSDAIRADRYLLGYVRGTATTGEATRPYLQTYRYGVQLPQPVATNQDGSLAGFTLSGATGFYQVDPANGRVYVQQVDEGATLTVNYTGTQGVVSFQAPVTLMTEKAEAPIPMDEAMNETGLSMSLDPFDPTGTADANRRPPLVWMFWRSTRFGSSDLFFQTIAPRFAPTPGGR